MIDISKRIYCSDNQNKIVYMEPNDYYGDFRPSCQLIKSNVGPFQILDSYTSNDLEEVKNITINALRSELRYHIEEVSRKT